ncbi:MAG TPA: T9SS type A sorting domain-containing protein [candidate division Zixibacteria bacterium]|nr:T9SS type A sorting domain-containing protein [candidate division Zixibacteria bacterium]
MGKPSGDPFTEGFPTSAQGAYIVVRADYTMFSNKPGIGAPLTLLDRGRKPEDYYMTIQWIRDPVRIWQKLYLLPEDSLRAFCNIEILAYNDAADSHIVGFKLFIDPKVGDNPNPVLEFPTGVQATTCKFTGPNIPAYWTLYEDSPDQGEGYSLAQGVPFGRDMLFPDEVAFANASDLDNSEWYFPFVPGIPITDLAMAFRWDNISMSPFSWYIVQIYYGGGYPSFYGISPANLDRPNTVELGRPYPNPFNARVSVPFEIIERPRLVSWNIYDITGRVVRHSKPEYIEPGQYSVRWDGRSDYGGELASGVYLFSMWADGVRRTQRLVILE